MSQTPILVHHDLECGEPARFVLVASLPEVVTLALPDATLPASLHHRQARGIYVRMCRRRPFPPAVVRGCNGRRISDNQMYRA
jgi:hypothetical protein